MALCPGLPGWAGSRKVKPIWIYWSKRQWVAVGSAAPYALTTNNRKNARSKAMFRSLISSTELNCSVNPEQFSSDQFRWDEMRWVSAIWMLLNSPGHLIFWSVCLTCGCLALEIRQHAVLACEAIHTCSLLAAEHQSLPAVVAPHHALELLSTQHWFHFSPFQTRIHLPKTKHGRC